MIHFAAYLRTIEGEADALIHAATGRLDEAVPSCPGWDLADLVRHTGRVHRWASTIVDEARSEGFRIADVPVPADEAALVDWFRAGADQLVQTLAVAGPDRAVWTFGPDRTSTFWARRQAHETTVHRWDAQRSRGTPDGLAAAMAADGVDEFLTVHLPRYAQRAAAHWADPGWVASEPTLHLHALDVEAEWVVRLTEGVPVVTREHARGDVAARGSAEALLLATWGRREFVDDAEVSGAAADVAAWQQRWGRLFE